MNQQRQGRRVFILAISFFLITSVSLLATPDFYVNTQSAGLANGSSWNSPATLEFALANASDGDEIWVAAGVYTNAGDSAFTIADNVTIYGGFTNGMGSLGERDWDAHAAHLDGGYHENGTNFPLRRVLMVTDSCTLDGLVISNGIADDGGALFKNGFFDIEIRNCRIVDCKMEAANVAPKGGAFYLQNGSSTLITNCLFARNGDPLSAYVGTGREGQVIYASGEPLTIKNSRFEDNGPVDPFASRDSIGGAIRAVGASGNLIIEDTVFERNSTTLTTGGAPNGGGALTIGGPDANIRRCVFRGNISGNYPNARPMVGGAIEVASASSSVAIDHCLFEDNVAGQRGYAGASELADGGALFVEAGQVTVSNCTFVGNHAGADGGAIAVHGGNVEVVNSIFYTNSSLTRASGITLIGGTLNVSYSRLGGTAEPTFIYDESGGVTLMNTFTNNPLFADSDAGDYHLNSPAGRYDPNTMSFVTTDTSPYSPCIDAGDASTMIGAEPVENGSRINLGYHGGTDQASKSPNLAPEIQNGDSNVNVNVVDVQGQLVNNDTIAECTVYFGTVNPPTKADTPVTVYPPQQIGTVFQAQLSGLLFDTTYYYRWYATNAYGDDWADTVASFVTGPEPAGGGSHIIHVDMDAVGSGDGKNWFSAFTSLADAMAVVNANTNEIWIADGTYDDAEITVAATCSIFGGFNASETNRTERDTSINHAHLDGAGVRRVMTVSADCTLDGLILTNGIPPTGSTGGGAIYRPGAHMLTISDCLITDNGMVNLSTAMRGAAIYLAGGGTSVITNSTIRNNGDLCFGYCGGGREGQAIYCNGENLTMRDCIIRDNFPRDAFSSRGNEGGALHAEGDSGTMLIEDCSFINNRTPVISSTTRDGGGAISIQGPDAVIRRCLFEENRAGNDNNNYDMSGGAIEVESGSSEVTIEYCLFEYNVAGIRTGGTTIQESYGGALFVEAGNVTVSNCNFVGNHSRYDGGAVAIIGGTLDIVNCIMYTNTAGARGNNITALGGTLNVSYSVLDGTSAPDNIFDQNNDVTLMNIATADPLFNNSNGRDYHLRSPSGRYNPGTMSFVTTDASPYSPAIDAGPHGVGVGDEPVENGNRINVGYYGGTDQASKSPNLAPAVENRDSTVVVNVVTVRGEMVNNDTIADCRLYYSSVNNPPIPGVDPAVLIYPPQQIGSEFETTLSGLDFSTTYHYQWCASNFYGEDCANTASNFVTGPAPPSGGPHIIHVKEDAIGSGDGSSWFSAYTSLNDAMAAVNNPNTNEIWVATAQYDDATVAITETCKIFGGFVGTETNRSQRSVATNGRPGIDGGNFRRCMNISGTSTVLLDGLAITNGAAASGNTYGFGINITDANVDLTVIDCVIRGNDYGSINYGGGGGYGINNAGADVAVTNTFIGDHTFNNGYFGTHYGLGIRQTGSGASLRLADCVISNNVGHNWGTRNSEGGALWSSAGTIDAVNCEFVDNKIGASNGTTDGGGLAKFTGGTQKFLNCTMIGSQTTPYGASAQKSFGGCMIISGSETYLENCTVADSLAEDRGAAFYILSGELFITNSILWSNQLSGTYGEYPGTEGRDIANISGYVEVSYSSLSGNETDDNFVYDAATVSIGPGVVLGDPRFAYDFNDVHLLSEGGRYDPLTGLFTNDTETSLFIDAGAPGPVASYTNETQPNGAVVNLGAYGNTPEASRTPAAVPPLVTNRAPTVTNNYATLRGELVVNDATADIFIYYGIGDSGESSAGWIGFVQPAPAQQSIGSVFGASIGGLAYNTTYTFRSFATNAAGFHWAQNPLTFTTGSEPPGGPDGVIHVRAGAPGSQDGTTWFDAVPSLGAAMALVNGPTNEIWIANRYERLVSTIQIETNTSIYGGFIGDPVSGESIRSQRSVTNATALDGNKERRAIDIVGGSNVIDGITISNCLQTSSIGHGLRASGEYGLELRNCVVENNGRHDNTDGSGAYFNGGTVYMSNIVFRLNGQGHSTQGGAIYANAGAELTVVDSGFLDNHNQGAAAGRQSQGGALYLVGGASLEALRCDFIDNKVGDQSSAPHGGGCAYISAAHASFRNCVFRGNGNDAGSSSDGPNGGVFYVTGASSVTVVNCTMAYNEGLSTTNGGMAYVNSSYFGAKNCIFWENTASTMIDSRGDEFYLTGTAVVDIRWTDITGTNPNEVVVGNTNATFIVDENVISVDPLFVSATDLHLKSQGGRYDDATQQFVGTDTETSICIDFGDPNDDVGAEPEPNGSVVNLGAYGGTRFASRTNTKRGSALLFK